MPVSKDTINNKNISRYIYYVLSSITVLCIAAYLYYFVKSKHEYNMREYGNEKHSINRRVIGTVCLII